METGRKIPKNATVYKIDYSDVDGKPEVQFMCLKRLVGERGFEPPTPWSRTRCSTRLSHSPVFTRFSSKSEYLGGEIMQPRFEQFIRERQFLANVTPSTIDWYKNSLKWLPSDSPTQSDLKDAVLRMRE